MDRQPIEAPDAREPAARELVARELAARRPGERAGLGRGRRLAGYACALVGLPLLTAALVPVREQLTLTTDILAVLLAVVAVALVGGLPPALLAAVFGFGLLNWFFTPPVHRFAVDGPENAFALVGFVLVATAVSTVVDLAATRARQVERLAGEAATAATLTEVDRLRTALLDAVAHDLRTPLAAATAAVSSLRSTEVAFSAGDRAELLATTEESLDRLRGLVENLLDMSRLRAGALATTLQPLDVTEAVGAAVAELGDAAREVAIAVPPELDDVRADPGLLQRTLVNVLANALRHSPPGSPPLITAEQVTTEVVPSELITTGNRAGTVAIRVVDHGPGVPEEQWDAMFRPFQRLGDHDAGTGVGLGLALSRGLVEAMGGTLEPVTTPGGGLTMELRLPAVPAPPEPAPGPERLS